MTAPVKAEQRKRVDEGIGVRVKQRVQSLVWFDV
jgi:hypothetical protein